MSNMRLGVAERKVWIVRDDQTYWFAGESDFFRRFVSPIGGVKAIRGLKRSTKSNGNGVCWIFDLKEFVEDPEAREYQELVGKVFGREVAHYLIDARLAITDSMVTV